MEKLDKFIQRMEKIGVKIRLSMNYPWIYITDINGIRVTETFKAEHGFTIAFMPIRLNQELEFTDIKEIFKLIKKYVKL
jgi:hypothetical protein